MMAWISPGLTVRLIPFNIFLPFIEAFKLFMINMIISDCLILLNIFLANAAFKAYLQKFLSLNCKFHWQFINNFACISVNDKPYSILC